MGWEGWESWRGLSVRPFWDSDMLTVRGGVVVAELVIAIVAGVHVRVR